MLAQMSSGWYLAEMDLVEPPSTEFFPVVSAALDIAPNLPPWHWRKLREEGLVGSGKGGRGGGPPVVPPADAAALILTLISGVSGYKAAETLSSFDPLANDRRGEGAFPGIQEWGGEIWMPNFFLETVRTLLYHLANPATRDRIVDWIEAIGVSTTSTKTAGWMRLSGSGPPFQDPALGETVWYTVPGDREVFKNAPVVRSAEVRINALAKIAEVFTPKENAGTGFRRACG
jgi:hypothetical protein